MFSSKNKKKYRNFSSENYRFYSCEVLQYITQACLHNEKRKRLYWSIFQGGGVWFSLMLNVPVNNFSVTLGRSHRFLGITVPVLFWGKICLAQGHNTATRVGLEPPTSGSGVRGVNHQATAPPKGLGCCCFFHHIAGTLGKYSTKIVISQNLKKMPTKTYLVASMI